MHVAIDLTSLAYNFSGIEQYALRITRELVKIDDGTIYTLVFFDKPHPEMEEVLGFPWVRQHVISNHYSSKLLALQLDVPKAFRSIDADICLFPAFPRPLTYQDSRSITVIHDMAFRDLPETFTLPSSLFWRISTYLASRTTPMVTVSEFSKRRISQLLRVSPADVFVVYNGVDHSFSAARAPKDDSFYQAVLDRYNLPERFVLSLCTIEPRKNLPVLIRAWVLARTNDHNVPDLVLAGRRGWKTDKLLADVPQELLNHVHLTGFVANNDLPFLYHLCDCFVYPSLYEGFGLPPLEALAAGAPVLCSDIEVFHETCDGLVTFFDPSNPHELARLLTTTLKAPSINQVNALCSRFSWQNSADELRSVLARIAMLAP